MLKQAFKKVNKNRDEVRLLLKQHKAVQKQKGEVNELLSQEKNFKIKIKLNQFLNINKLN